MSVIFHCAPRATRQPLTLLLLFRKHIAHIGKHYFYDLCVFYTTHYFIIIKKHLLLSTINSPHPIQPNKKKIDTRKHICAIPMVHASTFRFGGDAGALVANVSSKWSDWYITKYAMHNLVNSQKWDETTQWILRSGSCTAPSTCNIFDVFMQILIGTDTERIIVFPTADNNLPTWVDAVQYYIVCVCILMLIVSYVRIFTYFTVLLSFDWR